MLKFSYSIITRNRAESFKKTSPAEDMVLKESFGVGKIKIESFCDSRVLLFFIPITILT